MKDRRPVPGFEATIPILVVQAATSALGHGGLAIARSAGRLGIDVFGLSQPSPAPETRSRYWAGRFNHPGTEASADAWVERLFEIGRRLGEAVLVPTDDAATMLVAEHADLLGNRYRFPDQPPALVRRLSDKRAMHRVCGEHGVAAPDAVYPTSAAEVKAIADAGEFPIVAKRIAGWQPAHGPRAQNVVIARNPVELLAAYERMESPRTPNVMLQEYIPGRSDSVWMFNGYFDERSECLLGTTGRKLRQRGPDTGPTTLGQCVPNREVAETTRRLMKEVGYRGILDIGYRYDARDGRYKLLDVNPRIGSTFRLFVGAGGIDVLRAMYMDLTGQPVPGGGTANGRKWMVEPFDLMTATQLWRSRELGPRQWMRSLRGVEEAAWLAADDPLPFAAMVARSTREAARRAIAR
jgi:predicted ATP-grasp superfamily ATP-dependent carboligase